MRLGEVTEWLKVHDWNSCVGQLTGGSNPPLSAILRVGLSESRVQGLWPVNPARSERKQR